MATVKIKVCSGPQIVPPVGNACVLSVVAFVGQVAEEINIRGSVYRKGDVFPVLITQSGTEDIPIIGEVVNAVQLFDMFSPGITLQHQR